MKPLKPISSMPERLNEYMLSIMVALLIAMAGYSCYMVVEMLSDSNTATYEVTVDMKFRWKELPDNYHVVRYIYKLKGDKDLAKMTVKLSDPKNNGAGHVTAQVIIKGEDAHLNAVEPKKEFRETLLIAPGLTPIDITYESNYKRLY